MIYKDNKEICSKEENFKEKDTLNSLLTNYTFECEPKDDISKNKLTIKIEYNDKDDKKYLWVSDLKEINK